MLEYDDGERNLSIASTLLTSSGRRKIGSVRWQRYVVPSRLGFSSLYNVMVSYGESKGSVRKKD